MGQRRRADSIEYRLDGGSWTPDTAPFQVLAPNGHAFETRAVDRNGNTKVSTTAFNVYDLDTAAEAVANVVSTAGSADLTVSDPGHLANGPLRLPEPLGVVTPAAWAGPVSNATADIAFKQAIGANDALRTGTYSRALTFTLSTTTP